MDISYPRKQQPRSIAIFGAGGRMGQHVADYLAYAAPEIELRLLATSQGAEATLAERYPLSSVRRTNYFDRPSLDAALTGMEGIYVVTPSGLDEREAMTNFVAAAREAGSVRQIVRIMGYLPETSPNDIPAELVAMGGDGDQHYIAMEILRPSGLPITFLNVGASLMDNLLLTAEGIRKRRTLVWPHRDVPLIDGRDLGEVAARLFLSDDARHIGAFHTVNNGYDYRTTTEVAAIMSDALQMNISHDPSWEAFAAAYGSFFAARSGRATEAEYRFKYFAFESGWLWSLNSFAERILGRRPNDFRSWMLEHRHHFRPEVNAITERGSTQS